MLPRDSPFVKTSLAIYLIGAIGLVASDEEWKPLHYQVFATQGQPLEPHETGGLIEKLLGIYEKQHDENTLRRKEKLEQLFEASQVTGDKCDGESLKKRQELLQYNTAYPLNVLPFLAHYRREQFHICLEKLTQSIDYKVEDLGSEDVKRMTLLRETIEDVHGKKVGPPNFFVPRESLEKGVWEFMNKIDSSHLEEIVQHKTSKSEFKSDFNDLVLGLCHNVVQEFEGAIKFMSVFRYDNQLIQVMDKRTLEWIANYEICSDILENSWVFYSDTYKMLLQNDPNHKKSGRLSRLLPGCFKGNQGVATA